MVSPAVLGTVGLISSAAGTGISAATSLLKGKASSQQYMYQAGMADVNEQIAKQNAQWARTSGERENLIFGMKAGQRKGDIIAGQGASGVDVHSEGSARVRESQDKVDAMDRQQIVDNAARRAYGHDVEAFSWKMKGDAYKAASKTAEKAGKIGMVTSLISGATSVASKWYQGNAMGLWDTTSETQYEPDYYGPDMFGAT